MSEILCSPEAVLRGFAAGYQHDNYCPGDAGYCSPAQARWTEETIDLSLFLHLMAQGKADWETWFASELEMDAKEALHRGWEQLLVEPIQEEVVVLIRDGKGYIWDGWHRVGASIVAGRETIRAVVGRPI